MLEIFQYDFMLRAFAAGLSVAVLAPLAHVSLLGVAVGIIANVQPVLAAIVASVAAAVGIERLRSTKQLFGESLLALFLSGSLAVATVVIGLGGGYTVNLLGFLFGSITTVSPLDVGIIVTVSAAVLLVIFLWYRQFFAVAFDEELAQTSGIPAQVFSMALVVLAAITVSLAMRVVGVLLIGALMVIPALAAMQFGRSFFHTLLLSVVFSVVAVLVGLVIAFYAGLASGGTIVIVALFLFLGSVVLNART
jgi:zinc transport system permease protein